MEPSQLSNRLCHFYGYRHAVLLGRARSGIVALSEVLGLSGKVAFIPSNICPAVVVALSASGVSIRLIPVNIDHGLADDHRLVTAMADCGQHNLVMATHLYGQWSSYEKTRALATSSSNFLLENDTLCAARIINGERRAIGDALLTSFGYAKTINAGGGGAILTDDTMLANDLQQLVDCWPELDAEAASIEHHLMLARRHLKQAGCSSLGEKFLAKDQQYLRYAFPAALTPTVIAALDEADAMLTKRAAVGRLWNKALAPFADMLREPPISVTAPWRLIRQVQNPVLRDRIVAALRSEHFDAGTNFPALTESFPIMLGEQVNTEADSWSAGVLNLWLDDNYNPSRVQAAARCIGNVLRSAT